MIETLKYLTQIQPARNYRNLKSLNNIANYIKERFIENGLEVELQEYKILGVTYKNVIGVMNPEKEKTIIIGGHYDVCGNQQGADDNASAVAGLVETSKLLKDKEINYRLEFVAFTLEEPPFFGTKKMGSYVHAKSLEDRKDSIVGMINYEMIGYFSEEENSQKYPYILTKLYPSTVNLLNKYGLTDKKEELREFPTVGNFIGVIANENSKDFLKSLKIENIEKDLEHFELVVPSIFEKSTASDHLNYWKFDIPAVMITDTAFHRNPNYHKKTDTFETLNLEKMKETIEMTAKIIENL